jgi:hypothetical protein
MAFAYLTESGSVSLAGPGVVTFVDPFSKGTPAVDYAIRELPKMEFSTPGPISSLPAIALADVSIESLQLGLKDLNAPGAELKSCLVELPIDVSHVAVLSWRWDWDNQGQGSKNILKAIILAKQIGIRYLFVDVVSIDQELKGDDLIEQVMSFSTLYNTIPVLVAYEKDGEEFAETIQRPWILSEVLLFRSSPFVVIFLANFGNEWAEWWPQAQYMFHSESGRQYFESFLNLLCKRSDMTQIADLKFLMPAYARILTVAFKQMPRNDYLLTAKVLLHLYAQEPPYPSLLPEKWVENFPLSYDHYQIELVDEFFPSYSTRSAKARQAFILKLKGRNVVTINLTAQWNIHGHKLISFRCHPNAELAIIDALAIGDAVCDQYVSEEEMRRSRWVSENSSRWSLRPSWKLVSILS